MKIQKASFQPSAITNKICGQNNCKDETMNQITFQVEMNVAASAFQPMHIIETQHDTHSNLQALPMKCTTINNSQQIYRYITPQKFDILCGKEKVCINHEGSRHFRKVIDLYREKYQQCTTKHEKMTITKEIYDNLQQSLGSRFLRYNANMNAWDEVSEIVARDKISHALRFACLKQKEQQRQQQRKKQQQQQTCQLSSIKIPAPSSLHEVKSHQDIFGDNRTKERDVKIFNPVMRRPLSRCTSDPLPIKSWNQFVEQQQNVMRSIQIDKPGAASRNLTEASIISRNDPSRLMKIIDERPDLIMKVPLLSMDDLDASSLEFDEEDLSDCSDAFD